MGRLTAPLGVEHPVLCSLISPNLPEQDPPFGPGTTAHGSLSVAASQSGPGSVLPGCLSRMPVWAGIAVPLPPSFGLYPQLRFLLHSGLPSSTPPYRQGLLQCSQGLFSTTAWHAWYISGLAYGLDWCEPSEGEVTYETGAEGEVMDEMVAVTASTPHSALVEKIESHASWLTHLAPDRLLSSVRPVHCQIADRPRSTAGHVATTNAAIVVLINDILGRLTVTFSAFSALSSCIFCSKIEHV